MIKGKLFLSRQIKNLKNSSLKESTKKFNKIFSEINKKIYYPNNIFNLFNKNYKFSFKTRDLNKFKRFKKIALMNGWIYPWIDGNS